jgi:beta-glucosidase/6-phospho-beta-glucosidase/beta-galactosidase
MRMKGLNGISPLTGYTPEELERHGAECDDMWEQDSAGLVDCLREVSRRSGLPLFITENGVATEDEGLRTRYLIEHLESCHEAIRQGIDLRGYFYWSLVDNFEWGEGLSKRFGLLEVDFEDKNRRRSFRPAANVYAKISGDNALPSNRQIIPGIGSLPA